LVAARFRAVRSRRDAASTGDLAAIHRTRVAFKRFRYSVEFLAEALPRFTPARATALRRHQALMGAVQDAGVTLAWFSEFARQKGLEPRVAAATLQRLARRRDRAVARYLRHAAALDRFRPL
jgi:CHAD domain-containing protein